MPYKVGDCVWTKIRFHDKIEVGGQILFVSDWWEKPQYLVFWFDVEGSKFYYDYEMRLMTRDEIIIEKL
jgi:hypothetical protein